MAQEEVKKLREETGAGVMDCKRALDEASGDYEKAKLLIAEKGLAKAEKKESRETGAGYLEAYLHAGRIGVLLEMRCETDFVARHSDFKELSHELAMQIAAMNPESVETLLDQPYIKDDSVNIGDMIKSSIAKLGENIKVARFCRYQV
jgi:elongation factor Ts